MYIVVVGSGFSGSIIARHIAEDLNMPVTVIEKRNHIAGNMYDEYDDHGILVQKYGPHVLVSNDWTVMEELQKYSDLKKYVVKELTLIDGQYVRLPYNFESIQELLGPKDASRVINKLRLHYGDRKKVPIRELIENPDKEIRDFSNMLYRKAYKTYCAKQWGLSPETLDSSIMDRVPLNLNYEERYMDKDFQYIPIGGFTEMFNNILNHPNIEIILNTDFNDEKVIKNGHIYYRKKKIDLLIYTGAIDELFDNMYGNLPYRSLDIKYEWFDEPRIYPEAIISCPQAPGYTRITEYRYLSGCRDDAVGTTIATEYPTEYVPGVSISPFYPVITEENKDTYKKYLIESKKYPELFLCGRLAEFKYYNMDECIINALKIFNHIKKIICD